MSASPISQSQVFLQRGFNICVTRKSWKRSELISVCLTPGSPKQSGACVFINMFGRLRVDSGISSTLFILFLLCPNLSWAEHSSGTFQTKDQSTDKTPLPCLSLRAVSSYIPSLLWVWCRPFAMFWTIAWLVFLFWIFSLWIHGWIPSALIPGFHPPLLRTLSIPPVPSVGNARVLKMYIHFLYLPKMSWLQIPRSTS